MTTKAYRYARYSHTAQSEGMSLERQQDAADTWATGHGLVIDNSLAVFVDAGVSASRGKNLAVGALAKFRQAVAAGDVAAGSYLLVESVSRFSRLLPMDSQPVLRELVEAGIRVVFLDSGTEYNLDNLGQLGNDIVFSVKAHEAASYAQTLSGYRSKSWNKAKEQMRTEGTAATRMVPFWLTCPAVFDGAKVGRGAIERHPTYAPIVERMFREYVAGKGKGEIAAGLERDGVPCPARLGTQTAAMHWRHTIVGRVLSNRAVLGELQPMREIKTRITLKTGIVKALKRQRTADGEPIPGYYPRVISDELYEQARVVRESNRAHAGSRINAGRGEIRHILARLATCPVCGSAMKRVYKGDPRYPARYVCSRALAGKAGTCQRVYVSVAAVTRAMCEGAAALERGAPGADATLNAERGRLETELAATRAKAEGLSAQILAAALDLDESAPAVSGAILKAHAQLEARAGAIAAQLNELHAKAAATSTNVIRQRAARMVLALADFELLGEAHIEATAAVLYETFSKVVIDWRDGTLTCHWRHGVPPSVLPCREIKTVYTAHP
jgi:DNA invertase Pin-like site-specific DNA recombinase